MHAEGFATVIRLSHVAFLRAVFVLATAPLAPTARSQKTHLTRPFPFAGFRFSEDSPDQWVSRPQVASRGPYSRRRLEASPRSGPRPAQVAGHAPNMVVAMGALCQAPCQLSRRCRGFSHAPDWSRGLRSCSGDRSRARHLSVSAKDPAARPRWFRADQGPPLLAAYPSSAGSSLV